MFFAWLNHWLVRTIIIFCILFGCTILLLLRTWASRFVIIFLHNKLTPPNIQNISQLVAFVKDLFYVSCDGGMSCGVWVIRSVFRQMWCSYVNDALQSKTVHAKCLRKIDSRDDWKADEHFNSIISFNYLINHIVSLESLKGEITTTHYQKFLGLQP